MLGLEIGTADLALATAIMVFVIGSRNFVKAIGEWIGAFYNALVWIKRRTLDDLYQRVTNLELLPPRVKAMELRQDEHESDREAHEIP